MMERIASPVLVEYTDEIVTITLNRPAAMNGFNMEMGTASIWKWLGRSRVYSRS